MSNGELGLLEEGRKRFINRERAEKVQKLLDEAGYFKLPKISTSGQSWTPVEPILVNLLVDYLHFATTQPPAKGHQSLDLSRLKKLAELAYSLFEKDHPQSDEK